MIASPSLSHPYKSLEKWHLRRELSEQPKSLQKGSASLVKHLHAREGAGSDMVSTFDKSKWEEISDNCRVQIII